MDLFSRKVLPPGVDFALLGEREEETGVLNALMTIECLNQDTSKLPNVTRNNSKTHLEIEDTSEVNEVIKQSNHIT